MKAIVKFAFECLLILAALSPIIIAAACAGAR